MGTRVRVHLALVVAVTVITATVIAFANHDENHSIATDAFQQVWNRTDYPVQQAETERTWLWGPGANTELMQEEYAEAPDGYRDVQYFDKSRMEMPWLESDRQSPWYITQGLLARELMTGELQVGDASFESHEPSQRPAAGDPDGTTAPTYATMGMFIDAPPRSEGNTITEAIDRDGNVTVYPELDQYGATDHYYVEQTDQYVASVFWELMTSQGTVYEDGELGPGPVFEDPFYAVGFPLTPAYWAQVKVNDVKQDVLIQCFERRCLTFTPENDEGWQTESGNIGQHYYHWRYSEIDREAVGASFTAVPQARTHVMEDQRVILVTVYDEHGEPQDGVQVHGEVTFTSGENQEHLGIEMTGTSGDDGDGQVYLTYTGQELGQDNITVTVDGVSTPKVLSSTWVSTRAEIPDDQDDDVDPPEPVEPGDPYEIELAHDNGDTTTAGDPHTVVATVTDEDGNPVEDGTEITFDIDGPNSAESGTATTENGVATFTYTGTKSGTDTITASWNDQAESDPLDVTIEPGPPFELILSHLGIESNPPVPENLIHLDSHTIVGVVRDEFENEIPGVEVDFWIDGPNDHITGNVELSTDEPNRAESNEDGMVTFSYTGTDSGEDTVFGQVVNDNEQEIVEFVAVIWLNLRTSVESPDGADSHIGTDHDIRATVEYQDLDDETWRPLENALLSFDVTGDNDGAADFDDSTHSTGPDGQVAVDYSGQNVGTDTISATVMASEDNATPISDDTTVEWFEWAIDLDHAQGESDTNPIETDHTVTATVGVDGNGPTEGVEVTFDVSGDANPGAEGEINGDTGNTGTTGGDGTISFSYTGGAVSGTDTIEATVSDERARGEVSPATVTKTWVDYGIDFDHNPDNIFFTTDQVDAINSLALEHYGDGWNDFGVSDPPAEGDMSHYWNRYIDENWPNEHTVNVSVTEDGDIVESGEIGVLVERDGSAANPLYQNDNQPIASEVATFTYSIDETIGAGEDDIQATWGQFSNATTKNWTPLEDAEYDQLPIYVLVESEPDDPTVDEDVTITVTVLDQFGQPIENHPVDISSVQHGTIEGDGECPNDETTNSTHHCTDEDGQIIIDSHSSTNAGDETIEVDASGAEPVDQTVTWAPGAVYNIELNANPATQTVGQDVTLSATVRDQHNNAIPNVPVTFDTDRSGDPVAEDVQTGASGEPAEVTDHSQTGAGDEKVTATAGSATSSEETITWEAGPLDPDQFLLAHTTEDLSSNPIQTEDTNAAGTSHTVYALVIDEYGNPIDTDVTFTVAGENNDAGDRSVSQETGIASFTYQSNGAAGTDTITASVDTTSAGNELTKHWIAGDAYQIVLEHQDDNVENGIATNTVGDQHTVTATVKDEYGNVVEDYDGSLEFEVTAQNGGVVVPNENSSSEDYNRPVEDGIATFDYTWYTAGNHEISVVGTELELEPGSLTKVWEAGDPHTIELAHTYDDPENVVGTQHSVTATVVDQHGNVIEDWDQAVEFFVNDSSEGSEATTDGVAAFQYTGPTSPGQDDITASSGTLSEAETLTKTWIADNAHEIQLSHTNEDPENVVGSQHSVTATVVDQYGNVIEDWDLAVEFFVNDSSEGSEATTDGVAVFQYTGPTSPDEDDITAQSGSLDSNTLKKIWIAGDPSSLTLDIDPESQSIDETVDVTATVEDVHGNGIEDVTVTFSSDAKTISNNEVVTGPDGTASINHYAYDDQTSLTETITVTIDELDTSSAPVTGSIDWWEPGVPAAFEFGECDEVYFSGLNGYCFVSANVLDAGGDPVNDVTVEFRIDDESWKGDSGQPVYTLRNYDEGSVVGSGNQEQQKTNVSGSDHGDGTAYVTHVGRAPEDGYEVVIHATVYDEADSSQVVATDSYTFVWGEAPETEGINFTTTVLEDSDDWTSAGALTDSPDVIGRHALLEVEVLDGNNDALEDQIVNFEHLTGNSDLGTFSGDPDNPHNAHQDGSNPFEDVLTDENGIAQAIFYLSDEDDLPTTATIHVEVPVADDTTQSGDIRFIEFPEPETPTALAADAVSYDQIDLTWDEPADSEVSGYVIQWIQAETEPSDWSTASEIQVGEVEVHEHAGLTPETMYWYRIAAENATGQSGFSQPVSATTGISPPETPENLTASPAEDTSIDLEWDEPYGADEYELQRKLTSEDASEWATIESNLTGASYNDSGLSTNTSYDYRIRASNVGGESGWSNVATAETDLAAPVLDASADGPNSITLTWNDVDQADHYVIQVYDVDDQEWQTLESSWVYDVDGYTHDGLEPETVYDYRVGAVKGDRDPVWSVDDNATTDAEPEPDASRLYLRDTSTQDGTSGGDAFDLSSVVESPSDVLVRSQGSDYFEQVLTFQKTVDDNITADNFTVSLNIDSAGSHSRFNIRLQRVDSNGSVQDEQAVYDDENATPDPGVFTESATFDTDWESGDRLVVVITMRTQGGGNSPSNEIGFRVNDPDSYVEWD